jgi:hypothetical protein
MGMYIKVDSGWIGTAIGLAATAACVMWPSSGTAIGFILFGLAALVLVLGIRVENSHLRWGTRRRVMPLIGVAVFGFLSCSCAIWYLWSSKGVPSTVSAQTDKPSSLLDLYKSYFSGLMKSSRDYVVELRKRVDGTPDGNVNISYTARLDLVSKSKFYSFYINNTNTSDQTAAAAEIIGVNYKNIADKVTADVYIEAKDPNFYREDLPLLRERDVDSAKRLVGVSFQVKRRISRFPWSRLPNNPMVAGKGIC